MRRLESIDDEMKGVVTYELSDGSRMRLDRHAVEMHGASELLRAAGKGHFIPTERLPVIHHGRTVGTVPGDFDPANIKSNNYFYDPRPGDFKREGDTWLAARNLGPGDLDAVAGFVREGD